MLDLDTLDSRFSAIVKGTDGKKSVAHDLAVAYDDYAKGGTIKGASLSSGGDISLLESAFSTDGTATTIDNMSSKLCAYWQALPKIGIPAHGGVSVVSVMPAYSACAAVVKAAIDGCVTTTRFDKPYKRLFTAVETVLKAAPVTVTETLATTPPSTAIATEYLQ